MYWWEINQCSRIQCFGIVLEEESTFHQTFSFCQWCQRAPARCKNATTDIKAEFAWEQLVCIRSVSTHALILCCIENNKSRSNSFIPSKRLNAHNQPSLVYLTLPEFLLHLPWSTWTMCGGEKSYSITEKTAITFVRGNIGIGTELPNYHQTNCIMIFF